MCPAQHVKIVRFYPPHTLKVLNSGHQELDDLQNLITYKSWFDYDQPNRLNSLYTHYNPLMMVFFIYGW